ncbi:MAG: ABC transporter substrate-binding protein [Bryobacterales bacterium]|nr:ABC transporter substrate-binding protein [Bryobacterales bacterium]
MRIKRNGLRLVVAIAVALAGVGVAQLAGAESGGRLRLTQRAEPRTFNPVLAADAPTRDILRLLHGRLARIHGVTLAPEAFLARAWNFSADGKQCVVELRRDVRFSDGVPFTADDVVFTFEVYQDERTGSIQRDLLAPGGRPIRVAKLTSHTIRLDFPQAHAPGARLFDGIAILPRHRLEKAYRDGQFAKAWNLAAQPAELVGLGPFVLSQYVPGQRVVLKRNPHFWMPGKPYLDEVEILFVADQTAETLQYRAGESDLLSRPLARSLRTLAGQSVLVDAGSTLEYHFLFFNLNPEEKLTPATRSKQRWFRDERFRQAVSLLADREGMVKLAFDGRATALAHHVTPGNKLWVTNIPAPKRSAAGAMSLLEEAGFKLSNGVLRDSTGTPVEFTLAVNGANAVHTQLASILQWDLKAAGIRVQVTPLEFRGLVDRVLKSLDYEAAIMTLGSGDADPNAEMNVWSASGSMHIWNLSAERSPLEWEAEMDRMMRMQREETNQERRKRLYARVQELVAKRLPVISLVSPNLLVAHRPGLENVRPSVVPPYALWNIEEIRWNGPAGGKR